MRVSNLFRIVAVATVLGIVNPLAGIAADWVTTSHQVTVQVPESLSISADVSNFTLGFTGYVKAGDESSQQTVNYSVKCNNMRQADGAAAINANLDFLYDRLDLKADVGSYAKTSGNTELVEAQSGFVTVGSDSIALANKGNTTSGTDGKLLNGTIPITYKVVATDDVAAGDQIHILYVTLTSI